ncbi:MAG: hypothetical protein AB1566_00925 [Chloroflexota bacterium]
MSDSDFIHWLLAASTPSIRYLTLRSLLAQPTDDPEVEDARQAIMAEGPVPAILTGQTDKGDWAGEHSYYTPKYTSTHWSMLLLAELAADGVDPRLRRGTAFMLAATQDELKQAITKNAHGLSCFWGNLLRYALHCGQADDPRMHVIVNYLAHDAQEAGWRCSHNDELPCAWGAARALWGLAALPARPRPLQAEAAIQNALTFLLETYHLVEADYPTSGRVHPLWFRLNFPLFYQADILFVLRVLAELGALDHPGAQSALQWLASQRKPDGRWPGASPFRQRTWQALANLEETDRWASLQAAIILQFQRR